jgi:hypothetical protein
MNKSGNPKSVSFTGSNSKMVTGKLGALKIIAPTDSELAIAGHQTDYGSVTTEGSAAQFSLFPPTPTTWSITDTAHDAKFSIAVLDDVMRNSSGTVKNISHHKVLAHFTVDQSGTGSITYSDGSEAAITSWLLAD